MADRLHSMSIRLLRALRVEDDAARVSAPRLSALSVVVFAGPISMGELAAAEQVRPPTMTRLVQGLEAERLVERSPDPTDGRQVLVSATGRGRRLLEQARRRRVDALAGRLAALSEGGRTDVSAALSALEDIFGQRRGA
jgi:DNA-binding MarR family transcriptional regulator